MKTTGVFVEHAFEVPFKHWNKPLYIRPFGDVHWGHRGCDEDLFVREIQDRKGCSDTWYFGMGDYFDLVSTSERAILEMNALHESTKADLDDLYRKRADSFMETIAHCEGRIIGLVEGNHYARLESGITTTQYMCEQLKCAYLGAMTATRLNFSTHGSYFTYDIVAHHGQGAARLLGGGLNRTAQMAEGWIADLYLMGHDHKAVAGKGQHLQIETCTKNGIRIKERTWYAARTGGYLKGFINKRPTYQADTCKGPLALGGIEIQITPTRHDTKGKATRGLSHKVLI